MRRSPCITISIKRWCHLSYCWHCQRCSAPPQPLLVHTGTGCYWVSAYLLCYLSPLLWVAYALNCISQVGFGNLRWLISFCLSGRRSSISWLSTTTFKRMVRPSSGSANHCGYFRFSSLCRRLADGGFAGLAGVIYGIAWMWSGRLWVATLFHFGLNLIHLLFFTYPMYHA